MNSLRNRFFIFLTAALVCAGVSHSAASWSEGKPASWLVDKGLNGLEYTGYANIGEKNEDNTLIDYSAVGYRGGGVPIPFVPAKVIMTDDGPADDTARIQAAINQVSALPMGSDGFRGALLIKAGEYTVNNTLTVSESGVVIRGEGQQAVGGTKITYTRTDKGNLFNVSKSAGPSGVGGLYPVTDYYVPVGAKTFEISDGSSFSPGDRIRINYKPNEIWIADKAIQYWVPEIMEFSFYRTIEAVSGNRITLVEPIVETIQTKYGGAKIQKVSENSVFKNVGLEALRLVSDYVEPFVDDNNEWTAISLQNLHDSWVRQVTSLHFGKSLVSFSNCQKATVEDCAFIEPKSKIRGGNRYSFNIDDSQQIFFQRCLAHEGRHDFVSGSKTPGPNAWVDCSTTNSLADSGPHLKYGTGQLYDNIKAKQMTVQDTGGSHGWTGAQILFWNSLATDFITCDASVGAMNWVIGSAGREYHRQTTQDRGIWDSHNIPVRIRSLYYAQLEDRLGVNALKNIILPQQRVGRIWDELDTWFGDGLFGDDVVAWADKETGVQTNQPLAVRGIVRNLQMFERGVSNTWSKLSGPGTVDFADADALETTATFSEPGEYVLQMVVDDGVSPASNTVTVAVDDGVPDSTAPAQVTGLTAEADQSVVELDWLNNWESDLSGYSVYRRTEAGSYGEPVATGLTASAYMDTTVTNGTAYYYVVTAVDSSGNESVVSSEVSGLPEWDVVAPAVPQGLYAAAGNASVLLIWLENSEEDLAGYRIYRRTPSGSYGDPLVSGIAVGEYLDNTVSNGMTYVYGIKAVDVNGNESGMSAEVETTPQDFTAREDIDFGTDPGKVTAEVAGFTIYDEQDRCTFTNLPDGFQMQTEGFNNVGFVKTFGGLGGGLANNFTIVAETRVNELVGTGKENNDRWGISLFGKEGSEATDENAIVCLILAQGDSTIGQPETARILIRDGVNGTTLADSPWTGGAVEQDDNLTFFVTGEYESRTELNLTFTLSRADGSASQTLTTSLSGNTLFGDLFGGSLRIKGNRAIEYDTFSVEVDISKTEAPEAPGLVLFGSDHEGFAGYTTNALESSEQNWSLEPDSVRYTQDKSDGGGSHVISLLKPFVPDTTPGSAYTIEGIVDLTGGYGDDNNRIGILLFNKEDTQSADRGSGLWLRLNTDGANLSITEGINGDPLASKTASGTFSGDNWIGTRLTFTADIVYTNEAGTDFIDIVFTLTDANLHKDTLSTRVAAEVYSGLFCGFAAKVRDRGDPSSNRDVIWTSDFRSFSIESPTVEVKKGYDQWASKHGIGAADNDDDSDGMSNLYEYAMGGNPTNAAVMGMLPEFWKSGSKFMYVYPKRTDPEAGITYTVETTTNLISGAWTNVGYTATGTNVTGELLDFVTTEVDIVGDDKFIRLKIEEQK